MNIYYKSKGDNEIKEVLESLNKDSHDVSQKIIEDNIRMCDYNIEKCNNFLKKRKFLKKRQQLQKKLEELRKK